MIRLFIVLLIYPTLVYSNIEKKCSEIQNDQSSEKFICYGIDLSPKVTEKLEDMDTISTSLQQWIWLNDKIKKGIEENKEKSKALEKTKESFMSFLYGYPDKNKFISQFREVEGYREKYEELFQATKEESMLTRAIDNCGGTVRKCRLDRLDDFKVKHAKAQAKKLSILMSYPLLSGDVFRKSIEKQLENFHEYYEKDKDDRNFKTRKELTAHQKSQRYKLLPSLMLSGMKNIKKAMDDREEDWKDFQKRYENVGMKKLGLTKKSTKAPRFIRPTVESIQRSESGIINEILMGQDIERDINDPYLGKAICQINETQKDQLSDEQRNQLILDGTLMVAPFFLGPLGAATKLASLGRVANWGAKGKYIVSGAVEGGLLGFDYLEISKKVDECKSNFLNSLNPGEDKVLQEKKYDLTKSCEEELDQQIMFAVGGAALGPVAFLYGKAGRVTGKLTEESKSIIRSFNKTKNMKELKGLFDELDLSKSDRIALEKDYAKLKNSTKGSNATVLKKFEMKIKERLGLICKG